MQVQRYDRGRLDKFDRTGAGGLKIPATIARTGIQIYRDARGNVVREYRPPEEVFAPKALNTLAAAPVTVDHPRLDGKPVLVDSSTWKRFSVGQVSEAPAERVKLDQDEYVKAPLFVNDGATIADVEAGKIVECSAGYTCRVDQTPGVTPEGETYDCIQRNISFNHVALGPTNWARAGNEARLRLDGSQEITEVETMKIKVDGVECEHGSATHISLLEKQRDEAIARADAAEKKANEAEAEQGKLTAKVDSLTADAEKSKLSDQEINQRVDEVLALRADAGKLLGKAEYDFNGKTPRQIKVDSIKAVNPKFDDKDRSDDFVNAYFQARLDDADSENYAGSDDGESRQDDGDTQSKFEARLRSIHADSLKAAQA